MGTAFVVPIFNYFSVRTLRICALRLRAALVVYDVVQSLRYFVRLLRRRSVLTRLELLASVRRDSVGEIR